VHGIILFWLTHQLWQHATLPIIVTLGIVLTFPLAYLFHRLVELPTIQLGRRAEKALR
jgi:peptidoglycan/LPS O-acetylase OafA/YrhL